MNPQSWQRYNWAFAAVAVLSLPLFFYGLDDTPLWQDEAHTALLAHSVLQHGLPYVGEGAESCSALAGLDAGIGGIFLHIPPLQTYLCAASLALFGTSAWAARLPFALCGWLTVVLLPWAAGRRVCPAVVLAAQLVLATHVPYLLHVRQARYYAAAALLALITVGVAWRRLGSERAAPAWLLALSLSLLALTFEFAWAAAWTVVVALMHVAALRGRAWKPLAPYFVALALGLVVELAWLALASTAPSRRPGPGSNVNPNFPAFPWYYLGVLNGYVVPWLFIAAAAIGTLPRLAMERVRRAAGHLGSTASLALVGTAFTLLLAEALMYTRNGFPRYLVPAFPWAVLAATAGIRWVLKCWTLRPALEWCAFSAAMVIVASGCWSFRSSAVASFWPWERWLEDTTGVTWSRRNDVHLLNYVRELAKPPRGPVAACVTFLQRQAEEGQVIVAEYSEKPLKFHTRLRVYGGETGAYPDEPPDWIWIRPFWRIWGEVEQTRRWIQEHVDLSNYQRVVVRGVWDSLWENRPHPEWHVFEDRQRTYFPHTRPYLLLFRRVVPSSERRASIGEPRNSAASD